MTAGRPFVLAAGGTGGHMVPAHVLATELRARGHAVHLVTDARGLRFPGLFEGFPRTVVDAASTGRSGMLALPKVAASIWRGRGTARRLFADIRPRAVVGFGGYPALPGLLAALSMKLPTVIHEQNAVLGRVNRFLAPRVNAVATSYARVRRLAASWTSKTVLTGNPVRPEVIAARAVPFIADAPRLRLLVTGGSQGASILSQVVPAAVAALPDALRARLDVVHQARDEDAAAVTAAYRAAGIEPTVIEYLKTPHSRAELVALIAATGAPVRELIRAKEPIYAELNLADPALSEDALIDAMLAHPILINRPLVVTPLGTRMCRPSEAVLDLLPAAQKGPFAKEDGEVVIDAQGRRVTS